MGIYIKGEEMPETCSKCKLFCNEYMLCGVTGFPFRSQEMYERRMYDCPLVFVPPHGRLIDADELINNTDIVSEWGDESGCSEEKINDAPTIIPPEK